MGRRARGAWALGLTATAMALGCARRAGTGDTREAPAPEATKPPPSAPAPGPAPAPAPAPPPQPAPARRDRLLATETEYLGWRYFEVYCARCHGEDARGSLNAPDLTFSLSAEGGVTPDSFKVIVRNGSSNKSMKGFQDLLEDPQLVRIYAYVKARSDGRLAPGRPHRATTSP